MIPRAAHHRAPFNILTHTPWSLTHRKSSPNSHGMATTPPWLISAAPSIPLSQVPSPHPPHRFRAHRSRLRIPRPRRLHPTRSLRAPGLLNSPHNDPLLKPALPLPILPRNNPESRCRTPPRALVPPRRSRTLRCRFHRQRDRRDETHRRVLHGLAGGF